MVTKVRANERSYAIDLISHLNKTISDYDLLIKQIGGENTITSTTTERNRMFPDVVLFGDKSKTKIIQGWELKLPDVPITDSTFIKDAQEKAEVLNLTSCFIWNFSAGVLYIKNEQGSFEIAKHWNSTGHIKTRKDVETYRADWEKEIVDILLELNGFLKDGRLYGNSLGDSISHAIVSTIIGNNKNIVAETIKHETTTNSTIGAFIDTWWKDVQSEFLQDETCKYTAYAKTIILNWANRIIFANLIKKFHSVALLVERIKDTTTQDEANKIFEKITRKCDFYNIFLSIEHNTCLPADTWFELVDLNAFLQENGITEIEHDTLQSILESTVSIAKRELTGQYTTPKILAEILAKITIIDRTKNSIDPCCGSGTISKEVLNYKKTSISSVAAMNSSWTCDKYDYPLQIASISLTSPDTMNIPIRIFKQNALNLQNIKAVKLINPCDGNLLNLELPSFGNVVSNLPFVPFELISQEDSSIILSLVEEIKSATSQYLSQKSDLYSYIIFALFKVLDDKGRAGFITSNAWLGTSWGKTFFKALNYYFHVEQLHISGSERWFHNAQVVTMLLILTKKSKISRPSNANSTLFYTWKKSLTQVAEDESTKEVIVNSSLLKKSLDSNIITVAKYDYKKIETLLELNVSLNALFYNVDWLLNIKDKLIRLDDIFDVTRGERRGWDDLFYPEAGHNIEKQYIKCVLKNAKNLNSLLANPNTDAFCCGDPITTLKKKKMTGTIAWINRFQKVVNGVQKPLPDVLQRPNMYWYEMQDSSTADIVTTMNPGKRLFFAKLAKPAFINQRLIGLKVKNNNYDDFEINHALLNSIIGMFYIEAVGFGRGLGALDINKTSIKNAFMLNSQKLPKSNKKNILCKFRPLLDRNVKSTQEELNEQDRNGFDMEVLKAFGIEKHYTNIKQSLLTMQQARLSVR